ncbi:FAD-dependent oxidoreductase [Chitinophaga filiformis]|nr:FAD-dependent oxidoreductase [Chitinophaga filiformis]
MSSYRLTKIRWRCIGGQIIQRPHQNNGHSLLQVSYLNNRFYFCGTETATVHAGYMEGAVIAAREVARKISRSNH